MPRKTENLQVRSPAEARKLGTKGGIASGIARRAKRDLREHMQALLDGDRNGITGTEALALSLFEKALSGDVRAFEAVLALTGQTPRATAPAFPLPETSAAADIPKLTAAILHAVADGTLTPDEGAKIGSIISLHCKALETAELEARIAALEEIKNEV